MAARDDHSIDDEPHLRGEGLQPDKPDPNSRFTPPPPEAGYRDGRSVYDEPDIFPGRVGETVEQDWSCSACGYNLRGLNLEKGCPECGHREWYRPPPKDADSYGSWLAYHRARATDSAGWFWAAGLAILGGIFGAFSAMIETSPPGVAAASLWLTVIVFGPVVEEVVKVAAASILVETRPYRFTSASQIQLAAVGSAACFAVIENLLYLHVYISNPSMTLMLWRWIVCTALHVGCSAVATRGLIEVWQRVHTESRPPQITAAFGALLTAILIHGCYNAGVLGYESVVGRM